MIDIERFLAWKAIVLDTMVRVIVPGAIGVSTGPYGTRVHLPVGTSQATQDKISALLENDQLVVSANKIVMDEGDSDPVISCEDAVIASDTELGYVALLDGQMYGTGTTTVGAGVAQEILETPLQGVYEIVFFRKTGNYASGSVTITVNEV